MSFMGLSPFVYHSPCVDFNIISVLIRAQMNLKMLFLCMSAAFLLHYH